MRVMTLGQAPLAATPQAKFEALGYVVAGGASVLGLLLMAMKQEKAGYAVLISTALVGSAWAAARVVSA